ncbi:DUF6191 domain-containing protein [Streptomyces diastatochromogenes]|uniref:DUF6191 domain-containing protein n=1 Tax=Streptomyces diastatochromogenes TaxID=42236 RepID=UPI0036AAB9AE
MAVLLFVVRPPASGGPGAGRYLRRDHRGHGVSAGAAAPTPVERQSALVLRDDEEDGTPPHRSTVDLKTGIAVIRVTPGPFRS